MSTQVGLSDRQILGALLSKPLLDVLERVYPVTAALPTMTDSDRMIGKKLGERGVIDFLKSCLEDATSPQEILNVR